MSRIDKIDKIDTQGMSGPADPNYDPTKDKTVYKPAVVTPRRVLTPELAKEFKILINEVLDEREGRTGISYFDTQHFKHYVGEDEPLYEDWKQ